MKKIFLISLSALLLNCGSDGGDQDTAPNSDNSSMDEVVAEKKPTIANLVFPEKDKPCTEGKDFTETTSTITFRWNLGKNTKRVQIVLTDISTGEVKELSAGAVSILDIPLIKRNNQYKWKVISINEEEKVESPEWLFYNAGKAEENYAPFPAIAVSPLNKVKVTGNTVDIDWEASDLDSTQDNNDIVSYDLYFGEVNPPILLKDGEGLIDSNKNGISVETGKTYYWRIVTIDKTNNKSKSDIYSFTVE